MTLTEAAKKGITRLALVEDGVPVWNKYSFADLCVFDDGTMGPWLQVYDPCGKLACGRPAWEPIPVLTIPVKTQMSLEGDEQFEPYPPPDDMDRFPGCPPVTAVLRARAGGGQ